MTHLEATAIIRQALEDGLICQFDVTQYQSQYLKGRRFNTFPECQQAMAEIDIEFASMPTRATGASGRKALQAR
jgi:hypothetical protein